MAYEGKDFELPEKQQNSAAPWILLLVVIVVTALLAFWIVRSKSGPKGSTAQLALQQQLSVDKLALDAERQKVFDMTADLEALKQRIAAGEVPNKPKAVAEYNKLASEQTAQREKVKGLAEQYNQNVTKLQELK